MNIVTVSSIDFKEILKYLNRNLSDIAILKVSGNFLSDRKELCCNDLEFYNPLSLLSFREHADFFIEIGLTSSDYAKAGYFPLMLGLSIYNKYIFTKELFVKISIEHSAEPKIFSGLLFYKRKFEPIHMMKIHGPVMKSIISSDTEEYLTNEFYQD